MFEPEKPAVMDPQAAFTAIKPQAQLVGNAGLFYACYQLSRIGWNVMPTTRNARGVDIIAYSPDATRFVGIQVKALSKVAPVPLGKSLSGIMGDWWIVVSNALSNAPLAFIMLPSEVKEGAHRGEKDGRVSFWLQPRSYRRDQFRENWARLAISEIPDTTNRM